MTMGSQTIVPIEYKIDPKRRTFLLNLASKYYNKKIKNINKSLKKRKKKMALYFSPHMLTSAVVHDILARKHNSQQM